MHLTLGAFMHLNKNLKMFLQAAQNKCIRFCLKLGNRKSFTVKGYEKINCMPIFLIFLSCIYKFQAKKALNYMDEIFSEAVCKGIPTHYSYHKLKLPHCKTNQGLIVLSYILVLHYRIT